MAAVLSGGEGRAEVRAVYGGFGVAVAAVLVLAIADPDLRRGVVVAVAVALLGMAFGRWLRAWSTDLPPSTRSGSTSGSR